MSEGLKSVHIHIAVTERMSDDLQVCLLRVREKMSAEYGQHFAARVNKSEVIRMALERGIRDIWDDTRLEEDDE
jgi:hypothetical protein